MGGLSNVELMQNMLAMMSQQKEMMRKMAEATTLKELRLNAFKASLYGGQAHDSFALFKEPLQQYFTVRRVTWECATMAATMIPSIVSILIGIAEEWLYGKKKQDHDCR